VIATELDTSGIGATRRETNALMEAIIAMSMPPVPTRRGNTRVPANQASQGMEYCVLKKPALLHQVLLPFRLGILLMSLHQVPRRPIPPLLPRSRWTAVTLELILPPTSTWPIQVLLK
jgi:hypothetical protein